MSGTTSLAATDGVLGRRFVAWFVDLLLVGVLVAVLHLALAIFGVLTLGLGWALLPAVAVVPFLYSFGFLASRHAATPGQHWLGLRVVQEATGLRPTPLEALVSSVVFWLSLGVPVLFLAVLFNRRHRTLHDLAGGLVMVRHVGDPMWVGRPRAA